MIYRVCIECATPRDPNKLCRNPKCSRSKARKRTRTPNQRALQGVGPRGRSWRDARAKYLREHPICEWHEGCLARAHHVHHVDGMGPTGPAGLDEENFLGLRASHHARTETAIRARNELGQWIR